MLSYPPPAASPAVSTRAVARPTALQRARRTVAPAGTMLVDLPQPGAAAPQADQSTNQPTPPPTAPPPTVPPPPAPQPRARRGFRFPPIGVDYGLFLPANGRTRARFGSPWTGLGLGFGAIARPRAGGVISPDFQLISRSAPGSYVYMLPLGVRYTHGLTREHGVLQPFAGVTGDLDLVYLRSDPDHIASGLRTGASASAFFGLSIGRRASVHLTYRETTRVDGFDFSGVSFGAGIRF